MVKKVQYLLVHTLAPPARTRIQRVINRIIQDYAVFDMRGINPHITLKYYIEKKHLAALEKICTEVTCTHRKATFSVGGLGDFGKHVLFLKVKPSTAFKKIYDDLFIRCKHERIPLDPNERTGIHLHVTLAQGIPVSDFSKIRGYAMKQQLNFDLKLESITILKFANDTFSIHKKFTFVNT